MNNKKTAVAIFAHPDDEAIGPSGTLALLSQTYNVYLICATKGTWIVDNDHHDFTMEDIRSAELQASAHHLGIKHVYFLDYKDSHLCNAIYHKLASDIRHITDQLQPELIVTFEPHGLSGHIDHVAVSMISTYVFEQTEYIKKIWFYCLDTEMRKTVDNYFIHFPPGYTQEQIDVVVNVSSVWDTKIQAMLEHKSQKKDVEQNIERMKHFPKEEYFLERTK